MKNIFYIFIFMCISLIGKAQVYQLMPQYGYDAKRMKFDSTLHIPTTCGVPTLKSNVLKYGAIAFDSCNKKFYAYDPKDATWSQVSGGGVDTTSLSNRINQRVKYTDTSSMLSPYLRKADTISLENRKVPYTGATTDVDLGAFNLSAHELKVTGTGGQGKIDLRKQTSNSSTSANSAALYADTDGNLGWQNSNNYFFKLKNNHFTSNRDMRLPDSSGTFALLSNVQNKFVDSIYRKTANDSIFYRIGNTEYKIKDSTGSGSVISSPDLINGIATADVVADMNENNITFKKVDTFYIIASSLDSAKMFFIDATNYQMYLGDYNVTSFASFRVGGTGTDAGSEFIITNPIFITSNISDVTLTSKVQSNYTETINIDAADYVSLWVGIYIVSTSDATHFFRLPSASKFQGLQVTIINDSGADVLMADNGGTALTKGAATLLDQEVGIYVSDGSYWHGYKSVDR